jgi:hypothetical protein
MIGDLGAADATALAELVARGEVSPSELLDAALAAVEARNPAINAVVLLQEGVARKSIADGLPPGPFRGVPFLIKDLGCEAKGFPVAQWLAPLCQHGLSRRFGDLRADQGDGRGDVRAHDLTRRGRGHRDRGGGLWRSDAEPLEPGAHLWRVLGRGRGSGGGGDRRDGAWLGRGRVGADTGIGLRALRLQADTGAAAGRALCRRRLGRHGDRRVPDPVGARYGGDAGRLRGAGSWARLTSPRRWAKAMRRRFRARRAGCGWASATRR